MLNKISPEQLQDLDPHILHAGFDLSQQAKQIGIALFHHRQSGIAAPILYGDPKGASLYDTFISKAHNGDPKDAAPARLIDNNIQAIATKYKDIDRLVIIGAGNYETFLNQEGAILEQLHSLQGDDRKLEIVLIDVSEDYIKEDIAALQSLGEKLKTDYTVRAIQADFTTISGATFDRIMTDYFGSKARNEVKTGIISTGALFGNIENVPNLESVPTGLIEKRIAIFGEFGAEGSVIGFDCFSNLDSSYYHSETLQEFFLNGIDVVRREGPEEIKGLKLYDADGNLMFRSEPKNYIGSKVSAHRLVATQRQVIQVLNGGGVHIDVDIPQNSTWHMMYSLRPEQNFIINTSAHNTGASYDANFGDRSGLNFYVFDKTGVPAILESVNENANIMSIPERKNPASLNVGMSQKPEELKHAM